VNQRIKEVRQHYKKTQKEFGESLGVSRDTLASYESGRVVPSKTFIQLLCKTYNVNEEWLTTGQGDFHVETKSSLIKKLSAELSLNATTQKIIEIYLNLDNKQKEAVDLLITAVADSAIESDAEKDAPPLSVVDKAVRRVEGLRAARSDTEHGAEITNVPALDGKAGDIINEDDI